jgi:hypothetical protein
MKQSYRYLLILACLPLATIGLATTEPETTSVPATRTGDTARVVELLKSRYVDHEMLDDALLDKASLSGILDALGQGAVILSETSAAASAEDAASATNLFGAAESIARAEIIDPSIGYIRFANVDEEALASLDDNLHTFAAAQVEGYILDLRFADGSDYGAAASIAGRFLQGGKRLFLLKQAGQPDRVFSADTDPLAPRAGDGLAESPLLLLVNNRTRGSAEALAGGLRAHDRGILIGGITAGSAVAWEDVDLGDGRVLRIATAKVVLSPTDPQNLVATDIFPGGLAPDIYVPMDLSEEQEVLFNTSTNVTLTVSLQPTPIKKRMSEADLVKAFKGEAVETLGLGAANADDDETSEDDDEGELGVRDVVLQRAVDIMKGIRVLLSWK